MPTLLNQKWELFAQELAKGVSASEAYTLAGYKKNDGNAIRLKGNEKVKARIVELQERAAVRAEISIASVTEGLLRIAKKAEDLDDAAGFNVAKGALMDAAKVNGLIVHRTENENTNVHWHAHDEPLSNDEWAAQFVTPN